MVMVMMVMAVMELVLVLDRGELDDRSTKKKREVRFGSVQFRAPR
jgi:hypothetical protein